LLLLVVVLVLVLTIYTAAKGTALALLNKPTSRVQIVWEGKHRM